MKRYLVCEKCGTKYKPGMRQIYPASEIGEPAEFERVVTGVINSDKGAFVCDFCNVPLRSRQHVCARTIWTGIDVAPELWEHNYIIFPFEGC